MYVWMDGSMYACMHACMYVWIFFNMYIYNISEPPSTSIAYAWYNKIHRPRAWGACQGIGVSDFNYDIGPTAEAAAAATGAGAAAAAAAAAEAAGTAATATAGPAGPASPASLARPAIRGAELAYGF